jgi:hypothetical protein
LFKKLFWRSFHQLKRGKSRANLPGWMFRVCHNLALKHLERGRGRNTVVHSEFDWSNWFKRGGEKDRKPCFAPCLKPCLNKIAAASACAPRAYVIGKSAPLGVCMSLGAVSISLTRSLARFERAAQE